MFPQSLHKNIRELDKQITLLESECDNMESDKRKRGIYLAKQRDPVDYSRKQVAKETVERPFYTAPRTQETGLSRKTSKTSSAVRVCPRSSSALSKRKKPASTREISTATSDEHCQGRKFCPISAAGRPQSANKQKTVANSDCACSKDGRLNGGFLGNDSDSEKQVLHKGVLHANPGATIEVTVIQKSAKTPSNNSKGPRKSATSAGKPAEKNDSDSCSSRPNQKYSNQQQISDSPKWCEILCQESDNAFDKKNKMNNLKNNNVRSSYSLGSKCMSHFTGEPKKHASAGDTQFLVPNLKLNKCGKELISEMWNDENVYPQSTVSTAQRIRRPKSPFRSKNVENVIDASSVTLRSCEEKGIQCGGDEKSLISEESFDPLRTMCNLIEALKGNYSGEAGNKLLNDLESSLIKLADESQYKNIGKDNMDYVYEIRKQENEYVKKLQRNFLSTKTLCDKLMKERNKMSEDLAVKERLLATLNEKEKEYLTIITDLKVNLEKKRVLADDNLEALRELNVVKNKLKNETKVAEALRKSHAKLQDQIQKCTLENDKLKTEIRLNKLESQKFCVLLAGKDAEVKRYKDEVEAFQRQITDQLIALKSNNAANEVQKAMEAIMKQSQAFSVTDWDSAFSETQSERDGRTSSKQREKLMHSSPTSTKSSVANSSWSHISSIRGDDTTTGNEVFIGDLRPGVAASSCDSPADEEPKQSSFVSCKSVDDLTRIEELVARESSNHLLRKNIGELFQQLKVKCSQKMFSIPSESAIFEDLLNSSGTSDTSEVNADFLANLEKN